MSIQRIKRDLAELRGSIKPETPDYQLVIYDHRIRSDSKERNLESILKINGRDVSNFTLEEKEKILSVANVHLYLPKKDPYPRVTCDHPTN